MRRARIKPAINLGASRRPTTKPKPSISKPEEKAAKKSPKNPPLSEEKEKEDKLHPQKVDVTDDINAQATVKKGSEGLQTTDAKDCVQVEYKHIESVLQSKITKTPNEVTQAGKSNDSQEVVEDGQKQKSPVPVRRKRITAVPNFGPKKLRSLSNISSPSAGSKIPPSPPPGSKRSIITSKSCQEQGTSKTTHPVPGSAINVKRSGGKSPSISGPGNSQGLSDIGVDTTITQPSSTSVTAAKEGNTEENRDCDDGEHQGHEETSKSTHTKAAPPSVQRILKNKSIEQSAIQTRINIMSSQSSCNEDSSVTKKPKDTQKEVKKNTPIAKKVQQENMSGDEESRKTQLQPAEERIPLEANIYEQRLREMKDQLKGEAPSKRRKVHSKKHADIDSSKMRMRDLIYFNPQSNPMKAKGTGYKDETLNKTSSYVVDHHHGSSDGNRSEEENHRPANNAPQVKIGPDGSIILDAESLVKEVTPKRRLDDAEMHEVHEDASTTTYSSFSKRKYTRTWSEKETRKFYRALSAVGTDFSMINAVLPHRGRHEIKNKYKKEEKFRKELVDKALHEHIAFDMTLFETSEASSSEEDKTTKRKTKAKQKEKSKRGRKRTRERHGNDMRLGFKDAKTSDAESRKRAQLASLRQTNDAPTLKASLTNGPRLPQENDDETPTNAEGTIQNLFDPFRRTEESAVYDGDESSTSDDGDRKENSKRKALDDSEEEDYDMKSILGQPTRSGRQPKQRELFTISNPTSRPSKSMKIPAEGSKHVRISGNRNVASTGFTQVEHLAGINTPEGEDTTIQQSLQGIYTLLNSNNASSVRPRINIPQHLSNTASPSGLMTHTNFTSPSFHVPQSSPRISGLRAPSSRADQTHLLTGASPIQSAIPAIGSPNSFRQETFYVSMPGGAQSIIRMPVPNMNSVQYVVNIVPSPHREEGNILQLIAMPSPPASQGLSQGRALNIPSHIIRTPSNIVNTPSNIVSTPSNIVSTPSNIVSTPSNIVSTPSNIVSTPSNIVSTPSYIVSTPSCIVSTPSIARTPSSIVGPPFHPVNSPVIFMRTPSNILKRASNIVRMPPIMPSSYVNAPPSAGRLFITGGTIGTVSSATRSPLNTVNELSSIARTSTCIDATPCVAASSSAVSVAPISSHDITQKQNVTTALSNLNTSDGSKSQTSVRVGNTSSSCFIPLDHSSPLLSSQNVTVHRNTERTAPDSLKPKGLPMDNKLHSLNSVYSVSHSLSDSNARIPVGHLEDSSAIRSESNLLTSAIISPLETVGSPMVTSTNIVALANCATSVESASTVPPATSVVQTGAGTALNFPLHERDISSENLSSGDSHSYIISDSSNINAEHDIRGKSVETEKLYSRSVRPKSNVVPEGQNIISAASHMAYIDTDSAELCNKTEGVNEKTSASLQQPHEYPIPPQPLNPNSNDIIDMRGQIEFVSHGTTFEESDPIVAQQVDVHSSQEDDEDDNDEVAFVPP